MAGNEISEALADFLTVIHSQLGEDDRQMLLHRAAAGGRRLQRHPVLGTATSPGPPWQTTTALTGTDA